MARRIRLGDARPENTDNHGGRRERRRDRRANGEGGKPRQRADGRWQCKAMVGGVRKTFCGKTASEAREKMKAWLASPASNPEYVAEASTVADVLKAWRDDVARRGKKYRTLKSYESICRNHIEPRMGSVPADKLTGRHVRALLDELAKSPVAIKGKPKHGGEKARIGTRTLELVYVVIGAAFKARIPDLLDNVARPKPPANEMTTWNAKQASAFLAHVDSSGDPHAMLYRLALKTGARLGELLALTVSDFDHRARRLSITKIWNYEYIDPVTHVRKPRPESPKTEWSRRSIPLSVETASALRFFVGRKIANARIFADVPDPKRLSVLMRRAMRKAGVPVIRFHDLRHSFATVALANGTNPKVLSGILGHKSTKLTLDVYSHALPGMGEDDIQRLENVI